MNYLAGRILVLAQQDRLDGVMRGLRNRPNTVNTHDLLTGLSVVGVLLLVLWLISLLLHRRDQHRVYSSPLGLFLSLCRVHGLAWQERWLLWRLARAHQLRDPARLFLEPERLVPTGLSPWFQAQADSLAQLRERLFAGLEKDRLIESR